MFQNPQMEGVVGVSTLHGRTAQFAPNELPRGDRPVVLLVDPEPQARHQSCNWLEAMGMAPIACEHSDAAVEWARGTTADCAVLSSDLTGSIDCAGLIGMLHTIDERLPVIVTGPCTEVPAIMHFVRAGARDFLTAPVGANALVDAVRYQLSRRCSLSQGIDPGPRRGKIEFLSPREREILDYVARGFSTKQIAAAIGRVEKTIEFHRHNMMRKLGASNAAQLVHIAMLERHHGGRSLAASMETVRT